MTLTHATALHVNLESCPIHASIESKNYIENKYLHETHTKSIIKIAVKTRVFTIETYHALRRTQQQLWAMGAISIHGAAGQDGFPRRARSMQHGTDSDVFLPAILDHLKYLDLFHGGLNVAIVFCR
jgi:hypothetical protein